MCMLTHANKNQKNWWRKEKTQIQFCNTTSIKKRGLKKMDDPFDFSIFQCKTSVAIYNYETKTSCSMNKTV